MEKLIKVIPIATGDKVSWSQEWPDPNVYQLQYKRCCSNSDAVSLLDKNTEIWYIAGAEEKINEFMKKNSKLVTALTQSEADSLVETLVPSKTMPCDFCGGTGSIDIVTPVLPVISITAI